MKLVVGFITYNESSAKYLADFLANLKESIEFLKLSEKVILAFDNSSQDYNLNRLTLEYFEKENPKQIITTYSKNNLGFGAAYNQMITQAKNLGAEYFLMINPDILLEKNAIELLLRELESDKNISATCPKIFRWDYENQEKTGQIDTVGIVVKPGLKFIDLGQGEIDKGQYDQGRILAPSGAMGLFRLSDLEKIKDNYGYFDRRFFMYKEDCDLAYRLSKTSLSSKLVPGAICYHDRTAAFYGAGFISYLLNRKEISPFVRSWSFRNQHLLFVKHFKTESLFSKIIILGRIVTMFIFSLILEQFNLKEYKNVIKAYKS